MPIFMLPPKAKSGKRSGQKSQRVRYDMRDPFYLTAAWRQLRARFVAMHGQVCQCGDHDPTQPRSGPTVRLELDHIIERQDWPAGALLITNLIMLCRKCHAAKTIATNARRQEHAYYTRLVARDDPTVSTHPDDVSREFVELDREWWKREFDRWKKKAVLPPDDGRS